MKTALDFSGQFLLNTLHKINCVLKCNKGVL